MCKITVTYRKQPHFWSQPTALTVCEKWLYEAKYDLKYYLKHCWKPLQVHRLFHLQSGPGALRVMKEGEKDDLMRLLQNVDVASKVTQRFLVGVCRSRHIFFSKKPTTRGQEVIIQAKDGKMRLDNRSVTCQSNKFPHIRLLSLSYPMTHLSKPKQQITLLVYWISEAKA